MRTVATIVLILMGLGWAATQMPALVEQGEAGAAARAGDLWRRTADGWEKMSEWHTMKTPMGGRPRFGIHPALLALFQGLVSWMLFAATAPATGHDFAMATASRRKRHAHDHRLDRFVYPNYS